MEAMVNAASLFGGIYRGRRVLVTGHTGFKGSWLCLWLHRLGAEVYGYALDPPSDPNHFDKLGIPMDDTRGDVRELDTLRGYMEAVQPSMVFHMAAQSLVKSSYRDPVDTYSTNLMGCIHVMEACRTVPSVRAMVHVTSDKCYENKGWVWGYRENEPMGGYDPYSASKGAAELITASYRRSFFNPDDYGAGHHMLLASARAGNVIGGGDWAEDRLIPDLMRAAAAGEHAVIRSPEATRPWQHVLEPLSGYLTLGWRLLEGKKAFADGWNFGPDNDSNRTVREVVELATGHWSGLKVAFRPDAEGHHEAGYLWLDCTRAHRRLEWHPVWSFQQCIERTVGWYRRYYEEGAISSADELDAYVADAAAKRQIWTL